LQLLGRFKKESEEFQLKATNAWFVEGIATLSETEIIGDVNKERLYAFQQMCNNGKVFPLETLAIYKMGSFVSIAEQAQYNAYGQSWAFAKFLVNKYPEEFFQYLKRLSKENPEERKELDWFLETLDKDVRTLQSEFMEYMNQFEQQEDPIIEQFLKIQALSDKLKSFFTR